MTVIRNKYVVERLYYGNILTLIKSKIIFMKKILFMEITKIKFSIFTVFK